jgi:hypothetical protein
MSSRAERSSISLSAIIPLHSLAVRERRPERGPGPHPVDHQPERFLRDADRPGTVGNPAGDQELRGQRQARALGSDAARRDSCGWRADRKRAG